MDMLGFLFVNKRSKSEFFYLLKSVLRMLYIKQAIFKKSKRKQVNECN